MASSSNSIIVSQEHFRNIFNTRFTELVTSGLTKPEAAAQALLLAQREMSQLSNANANEDIDTSNDNDNDESMPSLQAESSSDSDEDESSLPQLADESSSDDDDDDDDCDVKVNNPFAVHAAFNLLSSISTSIHDETLPETIALPIDINYLKDLIEQNNRKDFEDEISKIFTNLEIIEKSFCNINENKLINTNKDTNSMDIVCENSNKNINSSSGSVSRYIPIDLNEVSEFYHVMRTAVITFELEKENKKYDNFFSYHLGVISKKLLNSSEKFNSFEFLNYEKSVILKPFVFLLEFQDLLDPRYLDVLDNLYAALDRLPLDLKNRLLNWLVCNVTVSGYMYYLTVLRQYSTLRLCEDLLTESKVGVRILGWLYAVRAKYYPSVSYKEFYNDALNTEYIQSREGRVHEYKLWIIERTAKKNAAAMIAQRSVSSTGRMRTASTSGTLRTVNITSSTVLTVDRKQCNTSSIPKISGFDNTLQDDDDTGDVLEPLLTGANVGFKSFISYPFVLSPSTKAAVLELDTALQMRQEMDNELHQAIRYNHDYFMPYFVLRIRRDNIVADTLNQIAMYDSVADFKKPLKVVFDEEEGVDAGGVRKEFYQVMTRQLMDPSYGMFQYFTSSRLFWFSGFDNEFSEFEMIGLLLGVAIYNSIIIDLKMPLAVYKKLKGQSCTLLDLADLQPDLAFGLQKLLEFEGDDVESTFELCFQLSYERFGEAVVVDLQADGGNVPVRRSNRQEYVDAYVKYLMEDSVKPQFDAFAKGFKKVCGGFALDLFEPLELELLICGNPTLDFLALETGTQYEDGFDAGDPCVRMFWTVVHAFNEEDKKSFLQFISGSDRSPIDGLSHLGFVVSRNGYDDARLPSAHTCFNHLLLPTYSTIDIMKDKLKYAISHAEGFGLR